MIRSFESRECSCRPRKVIHQRRAGAGGVEVSWGAIAAGRSRAGEVRWEEPRLPGPGVLNCGATVTHNAPQRNTTLVGHCTRSVGRTCYPTRSIALNRLNKRFAAILGAETAAAAASRCKRRCSSLPRADSRMAAEQTPAEHSAAPPEGSGGVAPPGRRRRPLDADDTRGTPPRAGCSGTRVTLSLGATLLDRRASSAARSAPASLVGARRGRRRGAAGLPDRLRDRLERGGGGLLQPYASARGLSRDRPGQRCRPPRRCCARATAATPSRS